MGHKDKGHARSHRQLGTSRGPFPWSEQQQRGLALGQAVAWSCLVRGHLSRRPRNLCSVTLETLALRLPSLD